jgi:F5/8 type C domain.
MLLIFIRMYRNSWQTICWKVFFR